MNCIILDAEQRTEAWAAARVGLLTGTSADAVIAERKRGTGELVARANLRRRLVTERLTGVSGEAVFQTDAMRRGCDLEPEAFAVYEARTGNLAERVGFVKHPELAAGCSPDGYVNNWEGLIEIKCPLSVTHLEYIQSGVLPAEYRGQCLHALWLTGAQWLDFCSFDPRFPEPLDLFIVRVPRVEIEIAAYDTVVRKLLAEVDAEVEQLKALAAA
jgi:hypothetical protein